MRAFQTGEELSRLALWTEADVLAPDKGRKPMNTWNKAVSFYPRTATVHSLFQDQAAKSPTATAVAYRSTRLTYHELNHRANAVAWRLIERGITPESPVGIAMERSASMVVAMLAVLKAGGTYVPLDIHLPASRLNFILEDTAVFSVIADAEVPNSTSLVKSPLIRIDEINYSGPQADENPPERSGPERLAYIMYTSGSTGAPKGVEIPHRGIVRLVKNTNYVDFEASDVVGQIANPAFDAITFEVWGALLNGAKLTIIPTDVVLSPRSFGCVIREEGITTMFLTASLFTIMAATEPAAFGTMRTLIVGGDAVDPTAARTVLKTAPPARLVNGYGPTECTTFSVCHWINEVSEEASSVPIGRPISNSEAYILDESLQPVPAGMLGDLYLGGDGLARGYLNRPELTAERFIPHPFDQTAGARLYRTGDRARFLEDGVIDFAGRRDHQVKFHGFRIELGEIETALRRHPAVIDAVAEVNRSSAFDERLVAYVSSAHRELISEVDLRRYLKTELPTYMIPSHVVVLDTLPLNSVGKVDRTRLPEPATDRRPAKALGTGEAYEDEVAAIWQNVLSLTSVLPDDNFFDVGGTSLTLALVEHKLRGVIATPFEITDLYRYPTIRSFCAFCRRGQQQLPQVATQLRADRQRNAFRASAAKFR